MVARLIRFLVRTVVFALPIVIRFAGVVFLLSFSAFMGQVRGAQSVIHDVTKPYIDDAIQVRRVPIEYIHVISTIAFVTGAFFYLIGFICLAYITVFIVEWIF